MGPAGDYVNQLEKFQALLHESESIYSEKLPSICFMKVLQKQVLIQLL